MTHLNFKGARTVSFNHAIGELVVRIEARVYPGCPARMYERNGDPGYPAEPPEVDFTATLDGKEYDVYEGDEDSVIQAAIERAEDGQ